ncbi:hypothetical protein Y032_0323g2469 [Ancylostoma ceylanicum]|uniref:Uncharacterized protein n=1 Tax=Ancylostoma ceylanicum TaxID=53326 RepID=A0A016S0D7_9BILA|nr:hypothetical protein Y032_0323g2469 [Ancylostoma ceylanicum]
MSMIFVINTSNYLCIQVFREIHDFKFGVGSGAAEVQCIRNDESAQAVHVTARSLADIIKITMKRDTQSRYDDVDCSQAWLPRPLGRTRRFG